MNTITKINIQVQGKQMKQLEKIEKELIQFKNSAGFGAGKIVVSLKGILKGVTITEKDIEEVKKSLTYFSW